MACQKMASKAVMTLALMAQYFEGECRSGMAAQAVSAVAFVEKMREMTACMRGEKALVCLYPQSPLIAQPRTVV